LEKVLSRCQIRPLSTQIGKLTSHPTSIRPSRDEIKHEIIGVFDHLFVEAVKAVMRDNIFNNHKPIMMQATNRKTDEPSDIHPSIER
jgi:hypothetical protein